MREILACVCVCVFMFMFVSMFMFVFMCVSMCVLCMHYVHSEYAIMKINV